MSQMAKHKITPPASNRMPPAPAPPPQAREKPNVQAPAKPKRRGKSKAASLPDQRLVIDRVSPELDAGRYAVKRVAGEVLRVGADVYKDGHDLFKARVAYRGPGDADWRYAAMLHDYNNDRWEGAFPLDRIGEWVYTVEAWPDAFGTWQSELQKKVDAGQNVLSELLEGAGLIERELKKFKDDKRSQLRDFAQQLKAEDAGMVDRVQVGLSAELRALMAEQVDEKLVTRYERELRVWVDRREALFASWYEMFPRSQVDDARKHGTFRDAARRLPRLAELGFDVVYLPPIHPVGKTMRKGKNNTLPANDDDPGSPWAIGSDEGGHTAIDSRLGTMKDFEYFVAECRRLGMEVALDNALQCSPDHPWLREHPEWFFIRPDGSIKHAENPPKKYQDIYPLNFWCDDREGLWNACRDIFLFWIYRGVKTFRVDNPHTKPLAFWEWVLGEVRKDHPEVVFLSEAFTRPKRMKGLAKLGFTQSYTYFTWRNTPQEMRDYLTELTQTEMVEYFRPNFFANTPDILHDFLQKGGRPAFRIRLLLAATLSPLYGIYSGFELCENEPLHDGSEEYLHSEKYEIRPRNYDAPGNINDDILRLNHARRENPALQTLANIRFLPSENERILFYHKHAPGNDLLIAVNFDSRSPQSTLVTVPLADLGLAPNTPFNVEDMLTGERYTWRGERNYIALDPQRQAGHVLRVLR